MKFNKNLIRLPLDYKGTAELAEIRVSIPSIIVGLGNDIEIDIGLELLDKYGFHIPGLKADIDLEIEGGSGEVQSSFRFMPEYDSHYKLKAIVSERGKVYRIRVKDKVTGIETISNPGWCPEVSYADFGLFWGDLHAHRIQVPSTKINDPLLWSYGPATVDEFYRYARDVVNLDFAALTDHDYCLNVDEWRQIQEGAQYYNQPKRFVTFLGYEWAYNFGPSTDHGHRVILFDKDNMPLISSSWKGSNSTQDLFNIFDKLSSNGMDILSIPHHPARLCHKIWLNWESYSQKYDRLGEVFSLWGSCEKEGEPYILKNAYIGMFDKIENLQYPAGTSKAEIPFEATGHFLQNGLELGHKIGFVGGSESHDGRAGGSVMHGYYPLKDLGHRHYKGGLTGIWARRKDRESLWSSLYNRRTIGTTGVRIIAYMQIDDQDIGSTILTKHAPKKLKVNVHGTGPLLKVVVVRNNEDWYTAERPGWDCAFELDDLPMPEKGGTDWYYLRVIQEDNNMAWTSPIWVKFE